MQSYIKDGQRFIVLDAPIEFYLAHSDDDFLCHFKYIRRYKVDGKWRYVYADKDTHKKINKDKGAIAERINIISDEVKKENERTKYWLDELGAIKTGPSHDKNEKDKRLEKTYDKIERDRYVTDLKRFADASVLTGYLDDYKELIEKNSVKTLATAKLDKAKNFVKNIFRK